MYILNIRSLHHCAGERYSCVPLGSASVTIAFVEDGSGGGCALVAVLSDCSIVAIDDLTIGRVRFVGLAQPPKGRGAGRRLLLQARVPRPAARAAAT